MLRVSEWFASIITNTFMYRQVHSTSILRIHIHRYIRSYIECYGKISEISQPHRFIFWALNGICALLFICSLFALVLLSNLCVCYDCMRVCYVSAHRRVNFRDISISFQLEIFIKSKRLAIITETLLYPVVCVLVCVCIVPFARFIKHQHLLSCICALHYNTAQCTLYWPE